MNTRKSQLNAKTAMINAHIIATKAADQFGGKKSEYMAAALKQAWQDIKNPVNKSVMVKTLDLEGIALMLLVMVVMVVLGTPLLILLSQLSYILVIGLSCVLVYTFYTVFSDIEAWCFTYETKETF